MRTITLTSPHGSEEIAYTCDSGYGSFELWLGFPCGNFGYYVRVTNCSGLDDALETIGEEVWKPHARLLRGIRADEWHAEIMRDYADEPDTAEEIISQELFPVNGGQHWIESPTCCHESNPYSGYTIRIGAPTYGKKR